MKMQKEDIKHIAKLAKLDLSNKEIDLYSKQLSDILGYINKLQEVDISKVSDVGQITGLENQLGKDDFCSCGLSQKELFKNAPVIQKEYIKVKSVLGRET